MVSAGVRGGWGGAGRLHPVPLVAGLVVALIGVQLGNWQLRRAEEKSGLGARIAVAAAAPAVPLAVRETVEWRNVVVTGEWLSRGAILVDNRVHGGRPGYHVVAPVQLAGGGEVVLVNRGWLAAGPDRSKLPEMPGGVGPVRLEGVVRRPEDKPFTLGDRPGQGRLWQVLDLPAYRQATGLAVADVVVYQAGPDGDGLVRDWPRPEAGIDRHRGYAVQWYGLAAAAAVMTGLYVVRSGRRQALKSSC